jgi:hypothetical protein
VLIPYIVVYFFWAIQYILLGGKTMDRSKMNLRATGETDSGLNTAFTNINTNRTFSREHVISQIDNGNPAYSEYHVVNMANGVRYVRSDPDGNRRNNLE